MPLSIRQLGLDDRPVYQSVSIAFRVESELRVEPIAGGLGGLVLSEYPVEVPYVKDYDRLDGGDCGLSNIWPQGFDLSRWGLFLGEEDGRPVAAATVAIDTPGIHLLEERRDLAVLWDVRVQPKARGRGVGRAIFWHAARWAREQGCTWLKAETQNNNVMACRFYAAQGCHLGAIHRYAYAACPEVAHETMLLWYLQL